MPNLPQINENALTATSLGFRSVFIPASDGLKLHVRVYGDVMAGVPLICLPGLSRNSADFDTLASNLSRIREKPHPVLALDYRGRGLSEWDENWKNYDVRVELNDLLTVLEAFSISRAVFLGTSRGGLIIMALASVRPDMILGSILNDIGPVIEPTGLRRIGSYIGKLAPPQNWEEAVDTLKHIFRSQYPQLNEEQWNKLARGTWQEREGTLHLSYDPNLMEPLKQLNLDNPLPPLWPFFDALGNAPMLVIHGALSDILSVETVQHMVDRRKETKMLRVPDQGHTPLLDDAAHIRIIHDFVEECATRKIPKPALVKRFFAYLKQKILGWLLRPRS